MELQKLFICFVAANLPLFQRTLVRRNNGKFTRLAYEVFYNSIRNFDFLRNHQEFSYRWKNGEFCRLRGQLSGIISRSC